MKIVQFHEPATIEAVAKAMYEQSYWHPSWETFAEIAIDTLLAQVSMSEEFLAQDVQNAWDAQWDEQGNGWWDLSGDGPWAPEDLLELIESGFKRGYITALGLVLEGKRE